MVHEFDLGKKMNLLQRLAGTFLTGGMNMNIIRQQMKQCVHVKIRIFMHNMSECQVVVAFLL